ncbi:NAD(P)-dependent oxidoreductase [Novosphingobium sediminicola]|uniref:3-hydroxyisobutyrate dehydrogenase n=1 Tax=Novosphingobium sediminicola TaxID=563162 RepID=A0A7W6CKY8_9SPHN|nr:NAD(P)-dependent oxidoreductase [Novosphingobium sediminicola]MBB3954861.1 3-hydroxyisobutyrate dehydrogenase [Novosphingobium sediminicola]
MTDPASAPRRVAVIGLGVMGGPIARHLGHAGHSLTLYNRTPKRIEQWRTANPDIAVREANNAADAAEGSDVVITCVGNDDDLAEVVLGPQGVFTTLHPGGLFIDHTTVSARIARQIGVEARDKEIRCVDAPMTGAQAGAEAGTLTLMCGGRADAVEAATPVMRAYARRIVHIGKAGTGQATKMVNQIALAGVTAALAEAFRLAQAEHLDLDKVYEAISGGAAQSWQMDNRWHTMAQERFDFGFAIDWMRKDLGLALDEGRGLGLSFPVAALIDQLYADIQAMGGGRQDTSAILRRLPKRGVR